MPTLTLVAGPNGSGKSTLTSSFALAGVSTVIDPDAFARRLNPEEPSRAAIAAARAAILRCRSLLAAEQSFILESTLAGHGGTTLLRKAKRVGYRTLLIYIALRDAELHVERVQLRVAQGGHDVPDADIRRRYARSILRAPEAIRLADEALVLDNSGLQPERMLSLKSGKVVWRAEALPNWVQDLADRLG